MFLIGLFEQLPVKILTVALLIILTVYMIRKSIKLFFDKASKKVRYELAMAAYKNDLMMAESLNTIH